MQIKTETKVGAFVIIALAIMAYMALFLGTFKWHLRNYDSYSVIFENVAGLVKKADVKIAGVKVGWVDKIKLASDGSVVEVTIMVGERYKLYADAKVEIGQDGLLGSKFVSIRPGCINADLVTPGNRLVLRGQAPVSIDDLINKFQEIAQNINLFVAKVAPASEGINNAIKKLDNLLEQDFNKIIAGMEDTLGVIKSIGIKLDKGTGTFSKLLNEPDLYDDIKITTNQLKCVSQLYHDVNFVVDSHFEAMFRKCDNYCHNQAKGYLDLWANFNRNYFGLFELVWSQCGGVKNREEFFTSYYNSNNQLLSQAQIADLGCAYSVVPPLTKETTVKRDMFLYGIQAGRWFNNIAFRAGLIESYFGFAFDYDIPLLNDHWSWVTTLECFDFKGQNRLCDNRPHFKWLNEVYYKNNLYLAFGLDDFVSKNNLNPFVGVGLNFGDD